MRLALVTLLLGCDWSLHRMQEPVSCTVHGATTLLPDRSCDLLPPEGTVAMDAPPVAPPPLTRALVERGRDRFERICAACHGVLGDGDSPVAHAMTVRRPPSLVDARITDDRVLAVIASGYGLMPAYRAIVAPADRRAIVHYIHVLRSRDVPLRELSPALQAEARRWLP